MSFAELTRHINKVRSELRFEGVRPHIDRVSGQSGSKWIYGSQLPACRLQTVVVFFVNELVRFGELAKSVQGPRLMPDSARD